MNILNIFSKPIVGVAVVLLLALGMELVLAQQAQRPAGTTDVVSVTVASAMSISPISISATKGSAITITLPSNHTTGYSWRLANKPGAAVVKFIRSGYLAPDSGTSRVGQAGVETWSFQAVGRGSTTIALEYVRPWEKNAIPAKKQVFTVNVK